MGPGSRLALAGLAAACALVASGAASGSQARSGMVVVPGKSMAGVKLGDNITTVRRVLGKQFFPAPGGPGYRELMFRVPDLIVRYRSNKVIALISSAEDLRTPEGLAVGQPLGRIRSVYGTLPTVRCGVAVLHVLRGTSATTYIGTWNGRVAGIDIALTSEKPCSL
jgi:hypothetical protein